MMHGGNLKLIITLISKTSKFQISHYRNVSTDPLGPSRRPNEIQHISGTTDQE